MSPKETKIGTASAANEAIGGEFKFIYYDFASKGRGEVMRAFFEEAGIAYTDVRYSFEEYNGLSDEERAKLNPSGSVPYLDFGNGKILTQTYPLLRRFAAQLGKYDGKDVESKYFADVICDMSLDWRSKFVDSAFVTSSNGLNPNDDKKPFEHHKSYMMPRFVKGIERHLATSAYNQEGPFTLGKELSYADFVLYQIYHDEREIGGKITEIDSPKLKELIAAFENSPRIKAYRESDRYYN